MVGGVLVFDARGSGHAARVALGGKGTRIPNSRTAPNAEC
jgi:hypothetical protein